MKQHKHGKVTYAHMSIYEVILLVTAVFYAGVLYAIVVGA